VFVLLLLTTYIQFSIKVSEFTSKWAQLHFNQPGTVMCMSCVFKQNSPLFSNLLANPAKKRQLQQLTANGSVDRLRCVTTQITLGRETIRANPGVCPMKRLII